MHITPRFVFQLPADIEEANPGDAILFLGKLRGKSEGTSYPGAISELSCGMTYQIIPLAHGLIEDLRLSKGMELLPNALQMLLDGPFSTTEGLGNLMIRITIREVGNDLDFLFGEPRLLQNGKVVITVLGFQHYQVQGTLLAVMDHMHRAG
jgi:hypothetical protein